MNIHWQIPFVSLRSGTLYTVNVYDADYSGNPIVLKGGAEPFSTEEDTSDDPFEPIRTQTGYLRIVDDGFAADGVTAFDWKTFVPSVATDRPVTLTHQASGSTVVDWQGFLQTQDYSGELYGNPQEREFPICCPLFVMQSQQPSTTDLSIRNFAYILDLIAGTADTVSDSVVGFDNFIVQGNQDAQFWLFKKFEWLNFLDEDDEENLKPKYSLYEILEEMCRFWGWSCRQQGRTMYLTCYDDLSEPKFVSMTRQNIQAMTGGVLAGVNNVDFIATTLTGNIFASRDNEDYKRRGPSKVTVKSDCNKQDTIAEFAPPSVRETFESSGYGWVAGDEAGTGYYTTTARNSFDSNIMAGTAGTYGGFCSRQIYSSPDASKPTKVDVMSVRQGYTFGDAVIQVQTKKPINFSGGSIEIDADMFDGWKVWQDDDDNDYLFVHVGIGMTRETAKWFSISADPLTGAVAHSWGSTPEQIVLKMKGSSLDGVGCLEDAYIFIIPFIFPAIPCDANNLQGYVFVDIVGLLYDSYHEATKFDVGKLKITYTREDVIIPTNTNIPKSRTLAKDRKDSRDYITFNNSGTGDEYDADLIFASDNNMEFGYGLLINTNGTWMEKVRYGHDISDEEQEYPEQHLSNRISDYWSISRRQIIAELRTDTTPAITPQHKLTLDGTVFNPLYISREWRDDVVKLLLLEQKT